MQDASGEDTHRPVGFHAEHHQILWSRVGQAGHNDHSCQGQTVPAREPCALAFLNSVVGVPRPMPGSYLLVPAPTMRQSRSACPARRVAQHLLAMQKAADAAAFFDRPAGTLDPPVPVPQPVGLRPAGMRRRVVRGPQSDPRIAGDAPDGLLPVHVSVSRSLPRFASPAHQRDVNRIPMP